MSITATREAALKVVNDLFDQHPDDEILLTEEIDYEPDDILIPILYRITLSKKI